MNKYNARKWKHATGGPLRKPNFKESKEAYYDPETDTVFAPDSLGEFYHHEMFHARPNLQLLESLKPYYHNLNDNVLKQMGADLSFVKRFNNDPGHFYSPEELGARVTSASEMLNRMGVKDVTLDFLKNARLNENAYGDNFRDLLHMYNDDNLIKIFNAVKKHKSGGILKSQEGTGNLLTPHPLSPIGIALNQAKAMAKMKGERQHLPPGVKEVVGPDGKKVAIRTEQPLQPLEQSIAEWLPGTGDVAEVGYIVDDLKNGNLGSATLGAGLLLLPGNAGKLLKTNVGKKISNFLNKDLFNYDALKIKLQNPHLKRYYHGSPYDFDIENFHKGTTYDMGLHASDRRKVAEYFSEGKGPVFEFFAPKPSAEIMDWHANDISLFVGNKKFSGGDLNIHDGTESSKLLFNSLRKYGGDDVIEFVPKIDPRVSSLYDVKSFKPFTLKRDVILDGSLVHKLDIPASEYDKLRQLYKDYPLRDEFTISFDKDQATRRAKINSEAATILSDNGYPVFKYENTVPNEGGGTSYMILDPSKIKLVDPKKTVKMKHALTGLGTGLGIGYGVSQLKDE